MKPYALAASLFLTGCGSTSTTIVVANKMTSNHKYGQPEIRLEFKINNDTGWRNDTQYGRLPDRN
jgi:hypothetical protein